MAETQHVAIDRLWPDPAPDVSDEALTAPLREPALRVNFVASVDGAVTRDGLSGGLGNDVDHRYFELLRRVADVVLVGAGTVRNEGYGPMRVSEQSGAWRIVRGMPEHPVFAIVSASLDLAPDSPIFTRAPVPPLLITTVEADASAFSEHAEIIRAGTGTHIDAVDAVTALRERGLRNILCEGGPHLLGSLLDADQVDELCLTVAPTLEAGDARRIASSAHATPRSMDLVSVHRGASTLLLRYARSR